MKNIVSLLFHRVILVCFFLLLQIAALLLILIRFSNLFVYFYWAGIVVSLLVVFWIIGRTSEPAYKIAWIIPILLFPFFGGLIYLILGGNRLSQRTRRKMAHIDSRLCEILTPDMRADTLSHLGADAVNQIRYLERMAGCPAYGNTVTEYYPLGDELFPRLLEELQGAERYIFMEYFIIEEGEMWSAILSILEEKAAAGLDVRVIYDDVGSIFTLPRHYDRHLESKGIRCSIFNPFIPVLSIRLNNRSHRKLCVIDGHIGFTGGINIADEYINQKERFGHWKDSAIQLRGDAVWSMTVTFLTMWDFVRGIEEDVEAYRPAPPGERAPEGCGYVQPYNDHPLDDEAVSETVYLNLITKAERYVYITTPYLILEDSMNTALCNVAKSGVDVRIITPAIPDKTTVFEMTQAHYGTLIGAGVKIYEYTPGFIHAKNFAVDDRYATVGSINLDYRSLFLHFENGVFLCDNPAVMEIKEDFLSTLEQCRQITLEQCMAVPWYRKALRTVLRVFAPLM